MKKNTKRNTYEEDQGSIDTVLMGALELSEFIESTIESKPRGRTSSLFKANVNKLIDEYNTRFGKVYNRFT